MKLENFAEIQPFSIWTNAYEKSLNEKYGIELEKVNNNSDISNIDIFKEGTLHYGYIKNRRKIKTILELYPHTEGFCSMKLDKEEELMKHIDFIYDLMFNHYILGKKRSNVFPTNECAPSAHNIMIASMLLGYPNASVLCDQTDRHCYTAFPFVLKNNKGFIIADPTSNQLWKRPEIIPPRNHIFVVEHNNWEYQTDYEKGNEFGDDNLYPNCYLNLDSFKRNKDALRIYFYDIETYFEEVFKHSIKIRHNQKA